MKATYLIKAIFLILSWGILFNGLESDNINSKIFFTSVLIYSGAIVFDLIFLCIESRTETKGAQSAVYKGSIVLMIVNAIICLVVFIGAMEGLEIVRNDSSILVVKVSSCGLTQVFTRLLDFEFAISQLMIWVVVAGVCSVAPGLLLVQDKR